MEWISASHFGQIGVAMCGVYNGGTICYCTGFSAATPSPHSEQTKASRGCCFWKGVQGPAVEKAVDAMSIKRPFMTVAASSARTVRTAATTSISGDLGFLPAFANV
jgi:hypothetical protein